MEKSIIDPKFEYEACKFVDFAKLQDEDDTDVDSWFGQSIFNNIYMLVQLDFLFN